MITVVDQAERLRNMVNRQKLTPEIKLTPEPEAERPLSMRIISITSGKGGVGKTNVAVNLAIQMSRAGKRVVVIDADFGLANVEVLLGISPQYTFNDVLAGVCSIENALTTGPEGVRFLSGGSGLTGLADITEEQMDVLLKGFTKIDELADILLIDTSAGMSKSVVNFLRASNETLVVTTPDPTSVTDAYAVIKALVGDNPEPPILKIVVNRVESDEEGKDVFNRLYRVCSRFLEVRPMNLGCIPYDRHLVQAVKSQEPVSLLYPNANSTRYIESICHKILHIEPEVKKSGIRQFINKWVGFVKK